MIMQRITLCAIPFLFLVGCSESTTESSSATRSTDVPWMLATAPGDARSVISAKAEATEGDTITVRGIIGGRVEALSPESPVFQIIDASLENPCVGDDDHCPTPWDYCCNPPEELMRHAATVQIVDASGAPVGDDVIAAGLEPLQEVIVTGTVGARPSQDVLTIRATGVHRAGG
ncbi:MAG: hypothetical protein AAFX79_03650 [Planctomycetota bacterium]